MTTDAVMTPARIAVMAVEVQQGPLAPRSPRYPPPNGFPVSASMTDLYVPVVDRYVGDDWVIGPIYLRTRPDGCDLTGASVTALVYVTESLAPVVTLTEVPGTAGGLKVGSDRKIGMLAEVWVSRSITSGIKPQDRRETRFPTRICIMVDDNSGRMQTAHTILFRPLDRRVTLCAADPEFIILRA